MTGEHTQFSARSHQYLNKVRSLTSLPVAVGFGIQSAKDVRSLVGYADIAIIGSHAVKQYMDKGAHHLSDFMAELRSG